MRKNAPALDLPDERTTSSPCTIFYVPHSIHPCYRPGALKNKKYKLKLSSSNSNSALELHVYYSSSVLKLYNPVFLTVHQSYIYILQLPQVAANKIGGKDVPPSSVSCPSYYISIYRERKYIYLLSAGRIENISIYSIYFVILLDFFVCQILTFYAYVLANSKFLIFVPYYENENRFSRVILTKKGKRKISVLSL